MKIMIETQRHPLMRPKITIGVCVRNCEDYINDAIDSISGQDFPNGLSEVVFVDDGSEDKTLSIIQNQVPEMDMNVRVFHQKWKGLGAARNVVVKCATAEYILWHDGDMVLPKDYVRKQVEFMEQHQNVGIAKGKQALEKGENTLATLETYARAASRMVDYNSDKARSKSLGTGGCIYRVEALSQVGGFDETITGYGEDLEIENRIRNAGWGLRTTDLQFRDYERRRVSWKDLWRRYLKRGYDLHQCTLRKTAIINLYGFLPPVAVFVGLFHSVKIYRLTRKSLVFLLPIQYVFKMTACCVGLMRSYLDTRRTSMQKSVVQC